MVHELWCPLDAGVTDLAYFLGVEARPFLAMKFFIYIGDKTDVNDVDKGITDIAVILNGTKCTLKSMGR